MNNILKLWNVFRRITALSIFFALCMTPVQTANADTAVFYAAPTSQGTGDCSSWANACGLVSALDIATIGSEVWVKEGVHKPTGNPAARSASFGLVNGVAVYGGFAGDETSREQRDWRINHTILSGDIDGNDDNNDGNFIAETFEDQSGYNSYHVVANNGNDLTAVLDGFIITAGNSLGVNYGGGIYNWQASPTLVNLIIIGNMAISGGGMFNQQSSSVLTNIAFIENGANQRGGGLQNIQCSSMLMNVAFIRNSATLGGGLENETSNQTLINVSFRGNSAENGGGLYELNNTSTLTNVTFQGNTAIAYGGGIFVNGSSSISLQNAVLWADQAGSYGAEIANAGTLSVAYSDVQGCGGSSAWNAACGTNSGGNIDINPLFVNASNGNLRLQLASPVIDAGNNTALPPGVIVDLGGNPRFVDIPTVTDTGNGTAPIIDMGAFEAYPDAVPPEVISVTRLDPSPSFESSVDYRVVFSEPVFGLDGTDFFVTVTGELPAVPVFNIRDLGDHTHYDVAVSTDTGSGTLRLNVHQDADVEDLSGNLLIGLPFTYGETYEIRIEKIFLPVIIR